MDGWRTAEGASVMGTTLGKGLIMINRLIVRLLQRVLIELGTLAVQGIVLLCIALLAMSLAIPWIEWLAVEMMRIDAVIH